jgi:NADH:ubiquinone oxidoreductase subunit 5 (subunit L)/multisubunit Na+/H+ antiporter MnhA subunit
MLFIGWEGVGICSYLLINYWYLRIKANKSALLAVIINKLGDIALLIGIAVLYVIYNNSNIEFVNMCIIYMQHYIIWSEDQIMFYVYTLDACASIYLNVVYNIMPNELIEIYLLSFLIACVGKSSQFGLHQWLPEAMEGPTPVSALLHAATMVTAGIYLILRVLDHFNNYSTLLSIISVISCATIVYASAVGLIQTDLKKIIAYSTMSQLGYMLLCCGIYTTYGFYHLLVHAFFKALLFLVAGLIIHLVADQQDIRKLGGLLKISPFLFVVMFVGIISLAGVLYFSGYYSKEFIVDQLYNAINMNSRLHFWTNNFLISNFSTISAYSCIIITLLYNLKTIKYVFVDKYAGTLDYINNTIVLHISIVFSFMREYWFLTVLSCIVFYLGYFSSDQWTVMHHSW